MNGMTLQEVERELLGAAILAPSVTETVVLAGDQFGDPIHGAIWDAVRALTERGVQPTPPLIVEEAAPIRVDPGRVVDLVGLGVAANAETYAREVLEGYDRRELAKMAAQVTQAVQNGDTAAETIRDDARTTLDQIGKHDRGRLHTWADIEGSVVDLIQNGARTGIPTPWPDLNDIIGGLVGSRFYLVAARPGEGKSLMAQGIATDVAIKHRRPVLFASLEMSEQDLGIRIVADKAGVSLGALQKANLTESQWESVARGQAIMANMPLVVNDVAEQTMAHIRASAIDLKRQAGDIGLVVIDYLQLVKPADERTSRESQVAAISRGIKLLAKELDVPVLALSQLNRNSLQREGKRPTLGDLRESGAQEQDADVVILMNLDDELPGVLHLQVAKNRHGAKRNFDLQMWGHYARLEGCGSMARAA